MADVETKPVEKVEAIDSASKPADNSPNVLDLYKSAQPDLFKPDGSSLSEADKICGKLQLEDSQAKSCSQELPPTETSSHSASSGPESNYSASSSASSSGNSSSDSSAFSRAEAGDAGKAVASGGPEFSRLGDSVASSGMPLGSDQQARKPIFEAGAPNSELQKQAARLLEAAEASEPGSSLAVSERMNRFERAARERGVSESEVAKTFSEVARLYEAKDNPSLPIDAKQRQALARQVLDNAADPTSIDQGSHNTCNVTTLESRAYSRTPSEAARIVADVATTGQYTSRSGLTVKLDKDSLTAHNGAENLTKTDGVRDFSGQLFQVTAVNLAYQKENPNIHYEQKPPKPGQTPPDNGERLMDYSTNPPTEVGRPNILFRALGSEDKGVRQPSLYSSNLRDIGNEITGEKDKDWLLDSTNVKSRQDFEDKLAQAKRDGKMPVVVVLHTGNEPFHTDSGNGTAGGSGGWHVVNVTDYQAGPPSRIAVDNQWGKRADHISPNSQISPDMLYFSTKDPKDSSQALEMAQRAREQKKEGNYDERFQLEALRKLNMTGNLSDDRYLYQLKATVREFDGMYKNGSLARPEGSWQSRLNHIYAMPISSQLQVLVQMKDSGSITKESFLKVAADSYGRSEAKGTHDGNNPFLLRLQMKQISDGLPPEQRSAFQLEMLAAVGRYKRK